MEKTLFKSKEEFDSFIDENTGLLDVPNHRKVRRWSRANREPKNYPCIAIFEIQLNGFGPDMLKYGLVYPEDFESM